LIHNSNFVRRKLSLTTSNTKMHLLQTHSSIVITGNFIFSINVLYRLIQTVINYPIRDLSLWSSSNVPTGRIGHFRTISSHELRSRWQYRGIAILYCLLVDIIMVYYYGNYNKAPSELVSGFPRFAQASHKVKFSRTINNVIEF